MEWRWIEEAAPVAPFDNMARDAALLDEMIASIGFPAVRVYRWSKPAVTVGRLQNIDDVGAAFPGMTLVRRPTGGRAVAHGEDLTVSVATRDEWLPKGTGGAVMSSYQVIVTGIVEALRRHGIEAHLGERRRGTTGSVDCFASTASCDIADVSTGAKLVGSAQRRERGAILQQMSIHGDIIRRVRSVEDLVEDLRHCLKASLGVDRWIYEATEPKTAEIGTR